MSKDVLQGVPSDGRSDTHRDASSTLSGSSANQAIPGMSADIIKPGISEEEYKQAFEATERTAVRETRGSGSDLNSDTRRLQDPENRLDKMEEDTFPASDPPSMSPMTGMGRLANHANQETEHDSRETPEARAGLPDDFKDNTKEQFLYGRRTERATHHFDRSSKRLEHGNPDVGEVDLGTIEADKPAQADDHDHYDSADDQEV